MAFLRIVSGYLLACAFAIAATSAVLMALEPGYFPKLDDIVMVAWFVVLFGWSGLIFGIVAEIFGYRSMIYFVTSGLLSAAMGILTLLIWGGLDVLNKDGMGPFLQQLLEGVAGSGPIYLFAAPAGIAAGIGYWLAAGRYSGT